MSMLQYYFEGDQYFLPRLQAVEDLNKRSRVDRLLTSSYCLTRAQVDRLQDQLAIELKRGVEAPPKNTPRWPGS